MQKIFFYYRLSVSSFYQFSTLLYFHTFYIVLTFNFSFFSNTSFFLLLLSFILTSFAFILSLNSFVLFFFPFLFSFTLFPGFFFVLYLPLFLYQHFFTFPFLMWSFIYFSSFFCHLPFFLPFLNFFSSTSLLFKIKFLYFSKTITHTTNSSKWHLKNLLLTNAHKWKISLFIFLQYGRMSFVIVMPNNKEIANIK